MKYITSLFVLLAVFTGLLQATVTAQSFEEALELYQQEQYEEALEVLKELSEDGDDDRIPLYTGKTYQALGDYLRAGHHLRLAAQSDQGNVSNEAYFTLALNEFRVKNFGRTLEILDMLRSRRDATGIRAQALRFYNEILRYLTDNQRFELFWQIDDPGIRYDLVRSAIGRSDYSMVRAMMNELEKVSEIIGDTEEINTIREAVGTRDTYAHSPFQQYPAPEGMVYHIGVALPSFDTDDPQFEVSRNLYFGITLAAESFNERNPDKKLFLRFRDTHAEPDSVEQIMHEFVWNERVDAILGPLFSETAIKMSAMAENYEIPMLTPLANSDEINLGHNYTFQINPTFANHGEEMARFAVNELNLDTLAIITERNSMGEASALAFRHEAERLGAHIAHNINEDFSAFGYDLSEVTEIFTTDEILADSLGYVPIKGVYAPFTGQAASTLINLLMTDLEAMRSDVVVMGSEEWRDARYTNAQQNNFAIYYTQNYSSIADEETVGYFREDYSTRFGAEPDYFSKVGYDAGTYLFQTLDQVGNPKRLKSALRESPEFSGLSMRIHFNNSQINRLVNVEPLTNMAREFMGVSD